MASSNASGGERSFSVLKGIKNYLRPALVSEKMSSRSVLKYVEGDLLQQIDWSYKYKHLQFLNQEKNQHKLNKMYFNLLFLNF